MKAKRVFFVGMAVIAGLLFWAMLAPPSQAQSYIGRPLTSYTIYATGTSTTDSLSVGARFGVSASAGGYAILRLVSPLSFFFNFAISRPAGIAASLSTYFLPANTVGEYRVPWGQWLAVITPTVLNSAAGRATITITEME